jgi:hypothetical protein
MTTSLTQREISVFAHSLDRNDPTEQERKEFFDTMPARIDQWFEEYRERRRSQMQASITQPLTVSEEFANPQSGGEGA